MLYYLSRQSIQLGIQSIDLYYLVKFDYQYKQYNFHLDIQSWEGKKYRSHYQNKKSIH